MQAQDGQAVNQDSVSAQLSTTQSVNTTDTYVPLTLEQNYMWSLHQMLNAGPLFAVGAGAALDHSRNNPSRWGQGAQGLAERAGSRFARSAARQSLAFGIRALDHEDPRHFHSHSKGAWRRARYAASRTFVARSTSGGDMPAYSTLVTSFATPFIVQTWRPEPISAGRELRSGGIGLGFQRRAISPWNFGLM